MSHTLITPQIDRSQPLDRQEHDIAARIVRETDAGIVLSGARMLATLSPFCDELLVMRHRPIRCPIPMKAAPTRLPVMCRWRRRV